MDDKSKEQAISLEELSGEIQGDKVWTGQQMWYIKQLIGFAEDARRDIDELQRELAKIKLKKGGLI